MKKHVGCLSWAGAAMAAKLLRTPTFLLVAGLCSVLLPARICLAGFGGTWDFNSGHCANGADWADLFIYDDCGRLQQWTHIGCDGVVSNHVYHYKDDCIYTGIESQDDQNLGNVGYVNSWVVDSIGAYAGHDWDLIGSTGGNPTVDIFDSLGVEYVRSLGSLSIHGRLGGKPIITIDTIDVPQGAESRICKPYDRGTSTDKRMIGTLSTSFVDGQVQVTFNLPFATTATIEVVDETDRPLSVVQRYLGGGLQRISLSLPPHYTGFYLVKVRTPVETVTQKGLVN
jgi:hypothetical protein